MSYVQFNRNGETIWYKFMKYYILLKKNIKYNLIIIKYTIKLRLYTTELIVDQRWFCLENLIIIWLSITWLGETYLKYKKWLYMVTVNKDENNVGSVLATQQ